jgi:hypothetical protein
MIKKLNSIFVLVFLFHGFLFGQMNFRISGEFSVKSKSNKGFDNLTMGTFYYDLNNNSLLYRITFPEKQDWYYKDTLMYVVKNNELIQAKTSEVVNDFTVFSLALKNNLANYGLKNSIYKLIETEKEGEMVFTLWSAPENYKNKLGNVLLSTKAKSLFGIIFYDVENKVVRKQFFKNYENLNGVLFPQEIVDIFFDDGAENYQVTQYSNIKLNEKTNNHYYNYILPKK